MNFHRRSIRFRFGEYDGRNKSSNLKWTPLSRPLGPDFKLCFDAFLLSQGPTDSAPQYTSAGVR